MSTVSKLWKLGGDGHFTCKEPIYHYHFEQNFPKFNGKKILEIGPGNGKFAYDMFQKYAQIEEYTILDIESQIHHPRNYLESKGIPAEYILSENFETLYDREFDIIISNVCLPEVPIWYLNELAINVFINCKNCFIIGGKGSTCPIYNEWIEDTLKTLYSEVIIKDSGYKGTLLTIGKDLI